MNVSSQAAITWDDVEVGYELPILDRKITAALVVGGAISATHDYAEVHHDYHAARKAGADNVFMNILTTNGLIGKYLTDWSGPTGEIKSIVLRLAVPNYPGDTMTFCGSVIQKYQVDEQNLVEVEFTGRNSLGNHAAGKAVIALPRR
ncbi:MaoC/PaaZ C-terminal domain-containing protein [Neobacillus kokaensis]|uniref:Beta-hydroxyacyl-ACP dehydratase n=1 Tax=Neobacillus kokaensis TaxID=2759023 RepID=A0ABQ3MVS8_9BACI|nr:MaoC/PaaZ C-terminal domain-containing protein [Neobacillus kokaensis]GHH96770.1 beta-hydroxyacyl-ACP dehydratase [Neobacillus kokaensis]